MLLWFLLMLLVCAIVGGGWGYPRYGYVGYSPFAVLLLTLLVLYFTGHLR